MSAGLSTTIEVVFTPQVNADIVTVFPLLAETGPINIPLECYCRKAIVNGDKQQLDFGSVIYGEEGKVKLVLTNTGALSVGFEILSRDGKPLPSSKPVRLAPAQLAENLLKQQEALEKAADQLVEQVKPPHPEKKEEAKKVEPEAPKPEPEKKEEKKVPEGKKDPKSPAKKAETKKEAKKTEESPPPAKVEAVLPLPEPKKEEPAPAPKLEGADFLSQIDFVRSGVRFRPFQYWVEG